jgi:sulfur relay (sulfurtransferase) complex TusBCD TusD component (DsrE family)
VADGEDAMKLLFIITKGLEKSGSAIRALQIAALTANQGNHVEVFLMDEAVHWAQGIKAAYGEGLSDYLDMLNTEGNPVLVCQSCAEKRLITQADLIEGTVLATMPTLADKIASPDYKVLTF